MPYAHAFLKSCFRLVFFYSPVEYGAWFLGLDWIYFLRGWEPCFWNLEWNIPMLEESLTAENLVWSLLIHAYGNDFSYKNLIYSYHYLIHIIQYVLFIGSARKEAKTDTPHKYLFWSTTRIEPMSLSHHSRLYYLFEIMLTVIPKIQG